MRASKRHIVAYQNWLLKNFFVLQQPMKKMTILFDADDVAENLCDCWIAALNERYGTSVTLEDVQEWDMTVAFPTLSRDQVFGVLHDSDFWKRLSPIEGAVEALTELQNEGHTLYMVTASDYRTCSAKIDHLLRLFPFLDESHIIISSNKQMIRGDILIDDAPHNLVGGEYFKILFDRPHNRKFKEQDHGVIRLKTWGEILTVIKNITDGKEECI